MRRRLVQVLVLVMLALATLPLLAADEEAPSTFETVVQGSVPDLTGRWLVVGQLSLRNEPQATAAFTHVWGVTNAGGKPNLEERFVKLPRPLADAVQRANVERRVWNPSTDDLQVLSDGWATLPPEPRGVASVETTISGKEAFTDVMKEVAKPKDTLFVVQMSVTFKPGQRPVKDVMLFGATEQVQGGYHGNYASVTVAAAPFPISIPFEGTFRMYRLEAVRSRSLLQRMLDVFSGCGRRSADSRSNRELPLARRSRAPMRA